MFKSSDTGPASSQRRSSGWAGLSWLLAALIPIAALAGVATLDGPDAGKPTATPKQHAANGAYQIRCWQGCAHRRNDGCCGCDECRPALPATVLAG